MLFILALALALAALYQAQQTVRSQQATRARLLRDYGAFAAWSYRQHATERLREHFRAIVSVVVHDAPDGTPAGAMPADTWRSLVVSQLTSDSDSACDTRCTPSTFVRVPLGAPTGEDVAGAAVDSAALRALIAAVRTDAASASRPQNDFRTVAIPGSGATRFAVYAVAGADSASRIAYAFDFDPRAHALVFEDIFASRQLLPTVATGQRPNAELLVVDVRGPDATTYFKSSTPAATPATAPSVESLGTQFGGLEVRAAALASAAEALGGGALPRGRLSLMAALLVLACGLVVIAVQQMRRDAELARMRSDFVSSVSHELRTPLAQIQLFLETLRFGRHRTDAQREWIFENMQRETTRLTALVDNVLHFSRVERGVVGGTREPTELEDYLNGVLTTFAPLASIRGVRLDTRFESGLVAQIHRESFRQVILNLLDNAVKYGPKGQTVTVATRVVGDRIHILVEDEGPGIEAAEREAVFEPFRRGEKAVGGVVVGSGIGLSVVRELVEWHEGRIRVEDAEPLGARFVIELAGWRGLSTSAPGAALEARR